ncbi:hypothetical protein IJG72_03045 [bacterium]|nr:hypothetical protein [bacterium]
MNSEQNDINANNCRIVNSRQFTHNSSLSTVHSLAFTLAETLIVMGIIGVVAALTIPNVNKNTGRAETVAKVKKIYAELNEAHNRATAVYGPLHTWFNNDSCSRDDGTTCYNLHARYFNRVTEFMKLQKNCGCDDYCGTSTDGCMHKDYPLFINGGDDDGFFDNSPDDSYLPRAITASGWSFGINRMYRYYSSNKCSAFPTEKSCGQIYVDIDGPNKGKNTWGIDLFKFVVTSNGIEPYGGGDWWTNEDKREYCFYRGEECAAWVINTGNMDYVDASHTSDDDAGVCKNGHQLTIEEPSCK